MSEDPLTTVLHQMATGLRELHSGMSGLATIIADGVQTMLDWFHGMMAPLPTSRFVGRPKKPFIDRYHARGLRMEAERRHGRGRK